MMYQFDRDTTIEKVAGNHWRGNVSPDWFFRSAPNGGYMLAMAARAMGRSLGDGDCSHYDPLSVNANFIAPAKAGLVDIVVTPLRQGKRFSQGIATVSQGGQPCVQLMATYTNLESLQGPGYDDFSAPEMPPPQDCLALPARNFPFRRLVEARLVPGDYQHFFEGGKGVMEQCGWVRFSDGRPADLLALLLFSDALPRAMVMRTGLLDWIPTMDLTVQCLAKPAEGYIGTRFFSRVLSQGVLEEQGELWDCEGRLVAISRQSAVARVPQNKLNLLT